MSAKWRHDGRKQTQLTDALTSERLRGWVDDLGLPRGDLQVHVDPSAASLRTQLRADGWSQRPADNDVDAGLREVASRFGLGRLTVDMETCQVLWRELLGYVWDPKASERGQDEPSKVNDHGPDALRYGVRASRRWWRHWAARDLDHGT